MAEVQFEPESKTVYKLRKDWIEMKMLITCSQTIKARNILPHTKLNTFVQSLISTQLEEIESENNSQRQHQSNNQKTPPLVSLPTSTLSVHFAPERQGNCKSLHGDVRFERWYAPFADRGLKG
jgi:hypothetical protein